MDVVKTCSLSFIPNHLHQGDRGVINEFTVGEKIFRRDTKEHIEAPFAYISLADVSVNRQGNPNDPICEAEDVLYNTDPKPGQTIPKFTNLVYAILEIKELHPNLTYSKVFKDVINGKEENVVLALEHDPIPCNYPHSVFSVYLNGIKIRDIAHYEQTLKQNRYKKLKNDCRLELQRMILTNSIRIKP